MRKERKGRKKRREAIIAIFEMQLLNTITDNLDKGAKLAIIKAGILEDNLMKRYPQQRDLVRTAAGNVCRLLTNAMED